jgi:hypothetical protein
MGEVTDHRLQPIERRSPRIFGRANQINCGRVVAQVDRVAEVALNLMADCIVASDNIIEVTDKRKQLGGPLALEGTDPR